MECCITNIETLQLMEPWQILLTNGTGFNRPHLRLSPLLWVLAWRCICWCGNCTYFYLINEFISSAKPPTGRTSTSIAQFERMICASYTLIICIGIPISMYNKNLWSTTTFSWFRLPHSGLDRLGVIEAEDIVESMLGGISEHAIVIVKKKRDVHIVWVTLR